MSCSVVRTFVVLTCLVALERAQAIDDIISWNYTDQVFWTTVDGWYCDGMRQSPINIVTNDVVMNDNLIDLVLINFDQSYNGSYENTGHSVKFTPNEGSPVASFRNHRGTYELLQFHFHWGSSSSEGSEHTINGQLYAGELHFVTQRSGTDSTEGDAFAVLGVLLTSDEQSTTADASETLMELRGYVPTESKTDMDINGVTPMDLLPDDLSYYYYEGSLTTPGCNEVVEWFLLRNPVSVPSDFLETLRTTVQGEDGEILDMNFRMTRELHGREVMVQSETGGGDGADGDGDNAASKVLGKELFVFVAVIVCLFYY